MKNLPLLLTVVTLPLLCGCGRGPKDFDVVANRSISWIPWQHRVARDPNGLPLNPKWGQQTRPGEQNTLPDPGASCPIHPYNLATDPFWVYTTDSWTSSPKYPHCTSVPVSFSGGMLCGSHVNFENVTYEGTVTWDELAFWDDDYDLDVRRDDSALYSTSGHRVHIEFDSKETVNNWDDTGTWWNRFHHDGVGDVFNDHAQASAMIDGSWVIVIGLLNMDSSHSAKTELHPVYAMFVHLPGSDVTRSSWAFFVRNWGNEGFCSDGDEPFETPEHKIKVQIPNVAGLISDNVSEGARNEDQLSPMQASMQPYGNGVLMTFTLLPPDKQSWFVGDLTFVARPPQNISASSATPAPQSTRASSATPAPQSGRNPSGETEPEERLPPDLQALDARIAKLPPGSRIELGRQLERLTPRKKSFPVKIAVLFQPAKDQDVHPSAPAEIARPPKLGQTGNPSAAELHRQKKIEFIKQFLAEKER